MQNKENVKGLQNSNSKKRFFIYLLISVVFACLIAILYLTNADERIVGKIGLEACLAFFSSALILALVDFFKDKAEDDVRKKEIEDIFIDSMIQKNVLVSKLNDNSVDTFMQDCISHYCEELSENYKKYIKNSINVFRKNFDYTVNVNIKKNIISQQIKYERFFKDCSNRTTYQLKCLFLFGTNELDIEMHNDSYFFCEELTNTELLQDINNILNSTEGDKKQQLIDKLKLTITIEDRKISNTDIKYEVLKNNSGLLFYIDIPSDCIKRDSNSYVHYKGSVSCKYKSDINNIFYCIFSNPTTGTTDFKIHFENQLDEFDIINNVKHMTILSLKDEDFELNADDANNTIHFHTKNTIFPRSGIVIRW